MLVRANTLARGHSGVRPLVIEKLSGLLNRNLTPVVPLRGTVSASGDLCPLSYIAGALQGRPGVDMWANPTRGEVKERITGPLAGIETPPYSVASDSEPMSDEDKTKAVPSKHSILWKAFAAGGTSSQRRRTPASTVLSEYNLEPLVLGPKEGLALVNGTAFSAGTGALALSDANRLAVLAQVQTAMSVEALNGSPDSFDLFLNNTRPHVGQVEVARNVRCFLIGSKLIKGKHGDENEIAGLRQDRYALRTTPQWIGPQLENLMLAQKQIEVECNSTTDNPIIDAEAERILHGGNFQAMTMTSAMEKIRQSLQILGRMIFSQGTEIINPAYSNGLTPNLEAGEPSRGFLMKGVDTEMAALQSELGFLANPVSSHVQTAEMGNQSLNSLALISARYTHTAIEVLTQLSACQILVLCQALDLRCLQIEYFKLLRPKLDALTNQYIRQHVNPTTPLDKLNDDLWSRFRTDFLDSTTRDSQDRFQHIIKSLQSEIISLPDLTNTHDLYTSLQQWTSQATQTALSEFHTCNAQLKYHHKSSTTTTNRLTLQHYLGTASRKIHTFVRQDLGIPFHDGNYGSNGAAYSGFHGETVGSMVTRIYGAIRDGRLPGVAMECLADAMRMEPLASEG